MRIRGGNIIRSSMALALVLAILVAPLSISQKPNVEKNGMPAGWSDEINLSNSSQWDFMPSLDVNNQEIYATWIHVFKPNSPNADHQVVFSKSTNGGISWSQFQNISNSLAVASNPEISVSNQYIYVVWSSINEIDGVDRIFYRNSINGTQTWNDVKQINEETGCAATGPGIYSDGLNVHIVWLDTRNSTEVYYRRSLNGGITFDNGRGIDQDRRITFSPGAVCNQAIAGDSSNISVVWADERDGDWEIYWEISKDNGFTWENGLGVENEGRKLTNDNRASIYPAIAVNGSDIHIVWVDQEWPGPVYRLYYINSTDNGATWNTPQLLAGPVPYMNTPHIIEKDDIIHITWSDRREDGSHGQIYYRNSTDNGTNWGVETRLTYNLSCNSYWARLAAFNNTKHLVWCDILPNSDREVMYKRYPDFPPDTTPPSHSNESPPPDTYKDAPGTNVSVHVTDPSGVNESTIQLFVNGSLVTHTLTPITDGYNISWDSPGFSPGVVTCRIVADDNLGNHLDYTWNFTVLATYNSQLHEGWNLISVPFVQVDTFITEVLKDIDGKWDFIEYYDATSGEWKSYATFWPESLNEFQEINNTMAIWINITEPDVNLTSRGIISTYTEIPLKAGWNFVGYPTQTQETVGNALWGTGADRVEVFDPIDPYRTKEVTSTYVMKPGEGYWVHVVADSIWTINW